ncbi:exopolysaccharide biosynthesis protein [Shinella sumterensis]|uniref:exopolysaccharide biosynthesis protein n=1 Tax=Shinella sumterensis TaxID=1967501 RepID=UPI00106DE8D4|nr:exopolysaccharide biosynthesis protein [Shinella sumterensis]MCD1263185.1 exopolysaccharide biosynthesis protein [Shinella sumterensis]TFE96925.1 protein exod [Shinella sumterensis]WLS07593.1 exopolysaccharide biosynthesis protein [Shinella sumterensis]
MTTGIGFRDTDRKTSELLEDILHSIKGEHITLRDLLAMMGESGLLLLCAFLSLPFLFPVSIPGVSTVFGAGIVLISAAITLNRLPWLPRKVADRRLESGKLRPVLERGVTFLRRIDRFFKPRYSGLTNGAAMNRLNGLVLMGAGLLLMAPLGLIPFSNTLPGVAILLMAAGISQRDGLVVLGGYVMVVLTIVYFCAIALLAYSAGRSFNLFG